MLKRIQRLRAAKESPKSTSASSSSGRVAFSLNESPLTRLLADQVGRGKPAKLVQQVAAAAAAESHGEISGSF